MVSKNLIHNEACNINYSQIDNRGKKITCASIEKNNLKTIYNSN